MSVIFAICDQHVYYDYDLKFSKLVCVMILIDFSNYHADYWLCCIIIRVLLASPY